MLWGRLNESEVEHKTFKRYSRNYAIFKAYQITHFEIIC